MLGNRSGKWVVRPEQNHGRDTSEQLQRIWDGQRRRFPSDNDYLDLSSPIVGKIMPK
jgi:hypothetical protein